MIRVGIETESSDMMEEVSVMQREPGSERVEAFNHRNFDVAQGG